MNQSIQISAIGLCTSLGGYHDACAAFRAGFNRFEADNEIVHSAPGDKEPTPLTIAPIPAYLSGFQSKGKFIKMLEIAYKDLINNNGVQFSLDSTLLVVVTPDPIDRFLADYEQDETESHRNQRLQAYLDGILHPLSNILDVPLNNLPFLSIFGERIAFARAVDKAVAAVTQNQYSYCLIAVVDSLLDYDTLDELINMNYLNTSENPTGFIAAEGAAFLLITAPHADSTHANPTQINSTQAINCNVSIKLDKNMADLSTKNAIIEQWQGDILHKLIVASLGSNDKNTVLPHIISDINAHENRVIELSLVKTKLQQQYPECVIAEPIIPALSFGESGCLAGAIGVAIACASVQRHYAKQKQFCILLSDQAGQRAVLLLKF